MNIYIPIEVKSRELEGKILLALVAAERGHEVLVGSKTDTLELARKNFLKPGIIHHKSIQPIASVINFLKVTNKFGHLNTTQDEENGLLDSKYDRFARMRYSEETIKLISKVFCWGQHDYSSMCRIFPEFKAKYILSGSPRVDLWRKDFSSYYSMRKKDQYGDYILIVSNFGSCLNINPLWKTAKFLRENQKNIKSNDDIAQFILKYGWSIELLSDFIHAILRLSKLHPKTNFIIRPHPVEETQAWMDIVGKSKNIKIIKEGSVGAWLINAKAIIYNGCTTALEAAAFGKTIVSYRPRQSTFEREIPNKVGYNVFSEKELVKVVENILNNNKDFEEGSLPRVRKKLFNERFCNLTGLLAADKIIAEWEKLDSVSLNGRNNWSKLKIISLINDKFGLRHIMHKNSFLKSFLYKRGDFITSHAFESLSNEEVTSIVNKLVLSQNRFKNIFYKRIGRRSFLFRKI
jgi:surface carbohydrate biosynthesis protein